MSIKTCLKLVFYYGNIEISNTPSKVLKNGKHKIRVAVSHNQKTSYIVQDVIIDNIKQFKDGRIDETDDKTLWCVSPNFREFKILKQDVIEISHVFFMG